MPLYLNDVGIDSELRGVSSVLIVPCKMCPAVTVAVKENEPFIQLFKSFLKSAPFERYIRTLQSRLAEKGIKATVFKCNLPHQWFLCMWSSSLREKLREESRKHDATIVLGCDSAAETVRELVQSDLKVVKGMEVAGFMNARLRFHAPGNISFEGCKIIPFSKATAGRRPR